MEDCRVKSWATGLKLGTESRGLFRNVTFRRCTVLPDTHRGISLQASLSLQVQAVFEQGLGLSLCCEEA